MDKFEQKWGIVFKAAAIVVVLLVVRLIIDTLQIDLITVNTVVGSFVGGAIFTLAIILTGTLVDFKEAEKIRVSWRAPSRTCTRIQDDPDGGSQRGPRGATPCQGTPAHYHRQF
jgi:RsiW-degrading membrane proteinase PrsW (M82 family)